MIISKRKYEIISSNATQILESVLDVYNQLRSSCGTGLNLERPTHTQELYTLKSRVNLSLANLIKWSDAEVLLKTRSKSCNDDNDESSRLISESSELINSLIDGINDLTRFCQKTLFISNSLIDNPMQSLRPQLKRTNSLDNYSNSPSATPTVATTTTNVSNHVKSRSSSASPLTTASKSLSSSSSIPTSEMQTKVFVDDRTGVRTQEMTKTLKLAANDSATNIIQTTTITRTTKVGGRDELVTLSGDSSSSGGFNLPDLRAFFDLEKLAQDLSEVIIYAGRGKKGGRKRERYRYGLS